MNFVCGSQYECAVLFRIIISLDGVLNGFDPSGEKIFSNCSGSMTSWLWMVLVAEVAEILKS